MTQPDAPNPTPRLTLLALGGTIASLGAGAGDTTIYALDPGRNPVLDVLAGLNVGATVSFERLAHLSSHDIPLATVLDLARRIAALFASGAADGVVVTQGTDTLEETAFLLDLLLPPGPPVVVTGAMRPASAAGADGPRNLYAALRVAADPAALGRGVLVCLNDRIGAAATTGKTHTSATDAFQAPEAGFAGVVFGDSVRFFAPAAPSPGPRFDAGDSDVLPRVDIVTSCLGMDAVPFCAALDAGAAGIVIAGTGNGSVAEVMKPALARARGQGVSVVRASHVAAGPVMPIAIDAAFGTIPSGMLNPRKARLLLMLALSRTRDAEAIAAMFRRY